MRIMTVVDVVDNKNSKKKRENKNIDYNQWC
jgi:hypothetical protein